MMDKNFLPPEDRELADRLETLAERAKPNADFARELEKRLMQTQSPEPKAKGVIARAMPAIGLALGLIALALVLTRILRTMPPQPAAGNTPAPLIPVPQETLPAAPKPAGEKYERFGQTIYLQTALPSVPAEASVYNYQPEKFASLEDARALAVQFGMNGQIYETNGEIPTSKDFLIVDGNQHLHVRSDQYFQYYPDYPRYVAAINGGTPPANAAQIIDEFLKSHGFDFAYELRRSEMYGGYLAAPLTPDGRIICYEYFKCAGLHFQLDAQGILYMDSMLPKYETLGQYGIISAEEAFQRFIDPESMANQGMGGLMEGMNSFAPPFQTWLRPRPLDETITVFGWLNSIPSLEGGAPLVSLDGYTATGNIADIPAAFDNTFVETTGQFHEANGLRTFELESWKVYDGYEDGLLGAISQQNGQVVLNTVDNEIFILPDASELPLPLDNAFVIGIRAGDTFEWKSIDQRNMQGGGGGGGGGSGFYKLNLTGAPIPFPTPIPRVEGGGGGGGGSIEAYLVQEGDTINSIAAANGITPEELMQLNGMTDASQLQVGQTLTIRSESMSLPQSVEGLRGYLAITIYKQVDGNQRVEYGFINDAVPFPYMTLEGENLEALQAYQGRPVDMWGTIESREGQIVLKVERYEIPFPDLQFQILRGTQTPATLDGQSITLFTTDDGKTYAQFNPGGGLDGSTVGNLDDEVLIEALIVPGETFGGYPALRIFSAASAINPKNGEAQELQISADQIYIVDEAVEGPPTQPTLAIERVELVYYMPEPRYQVDEFSPDQRYLQPAWLFTGHYSDGTGFFILVQALQQEFLLPEPVPFPGPG